MTQSACPSTRTQGVFKNFADQGETEGQTLPGFLLGHGQFASKLASTWGFMMDYTTGTPTARTYVNGALWHTDTTVGPGTVYPYIESTNDDFGGSKVAGATLKFNEASLQFCS